MPFDVSIFGTFTSELVLVFHRSPVNRVLVRGSREGVAAVPFSEVAGPQNGVV